MCGIIGIVATQGVHVNQLLYDGLTVLQHRGQDAAGIVTMSEDQFHLRKGIGLVKDVFRTRHMNSLLGNTGIGHVRYPTAGSSSSAEAQPFYVNSPFGICLAHNGNLTNTDELRTRVIANTARHLNTSSDSEVLLNVFADALQRRSGQISIEGDLHLDIESVFASVEEINQLCKGGYACISVINGYGLLAFRDPNGIRPLMIGRRLVDGVEEWMVASESVAAISLGFEVVRDVEPGEAVFITNQGTLLSRMCAEIKEHSPCIFEYVYFARPDSVIDGISVSEARLNMGDLLAKRIMEQHPDLVVDTVIPVPDSGRISAMELARTLGVSYREGFVKNRYIGRTFIMPGQAIRQQSVRKKLNVIPHEFAGKNVLIVDDSIVRGNTSQKIVEMAKKAGANKVYFASAAPPVIHPNVYGIDMPAATEFIANGRSNEQIAEEIGADLLFYQTLEDLITATSIGERPPDRFDCSCFDADYVTGDISTDYLNALEMARNDAAKQVRAVSSEVMDLYNDE